MDTRNSKRQNTYLDPENETNTDTLSHDEPPPKKAKSLPKKKAKIFDGRYYRITKYENGSILAECTICKEIKRGSESSTGNFISHFKTKHKDTVGALKTYLKIQDEVQINEKSSQRKMNEFMNPPSENITAKFVDFIVDGNLSFRVAQSPSLKTLLETVSGRKIKMPTRHAFMSTLDRQFENTKTELRMLLKKQQYLCVTADAWSSRAQSYLGVTVHFINKSYLRESYVLAFKQLHTRQTYKELADALHAVFKDYEIDIKQITNIVTDGGSNFCKMFKKFGKSIDAVVTTYDDDIEPQECEDDVITPFMVDANGEYFANDVLNFNGGENVALDLDESNDGPDLDCDNADDYFNCDNITPPREEINLPPQRRCISHLLNSLSNDFEKKFLNGKAKTALCQSVSKLHTLWVLTHRSSRSKSIANEILGRCLKVPSDTRWNSKFDAIKMCDDPEVKGKLNQLIEKLKSELNCRSSKSLQTLTKNDFSVISQYINVMEPVAQALDTMQKEFNSSQGYIVPVLLSMKLRVNNICDSSAIANDFKTAMLKAIDVRFNNYFLFEDFNLDLLLSAVTIPRIKTSFIQHDDNIIYVKNRLINECKKIKSEEMISLPIVQDEAVPESNDDFIISFIANRDVRRTSIEGEIESEVSRYLCDFRKEMNILDEYPNVRAVFFKYNTTLSSSAPVERVFSQSLMIFTPRRNRISADHFEQSLLLKHNRLLLDKSKNC